MRHAQSAFGLIVLLLIAWLLSEHRRLVAWRFVALGMLLQVALASLFLKLPFTARLFAELNRGVMAVQRATEAGSTFVFGFLGGGPPPYAETHVGASVVLAFRILPLIIVVSALAALLTYWRILPAVVQAFARLFERALGVGGAVALCSVANPFLGMVESSILVRPYIEHLTRSELCIVMCTGLATIAGTVLVLYATMLAPVIPDAAGHLLIASMISLPAAVVIARIMVPESLPPTPGQLVRGDVHGAFEAITQGTRQGLELFLNIVAILLVFVALVHLLDEFLSLLPPVHGSPLTLERALGWAFAPVAWLLGVPWTEAPTVGGLLGTKTVLNELLAYRELSGLADTALGQRSRLIATYALCGFANFGSVGILVTGLATMAPARRAEIAALGLRALAGGTLATCATAAVVGMLV
ncbi:MAG TPA: nucleoside transporter C-terminal domain-containing protein [Steroidobacteraceae bacterium]|nr:nucleoside transporter C-terminal domain-containing protein [Steroidobacteraceae bacterium]